jgi:hypothetical protein
VTGIETKAVPWLTSHLQETESGVITLNDDPEFTNAIDCMVSYFYKACYDVSQYDTSESLLHAQVATIADKYDCASLFKLASTSLTDTIHAIESEDWVPVAALVYDHTTTELQAHKELRGLVVAAVVNRPAVLNSILELESTADLLRSNADLAIDLLLSGLRSRKVQDVAMHMFVCDKCRYAHAGSRDCAYVTSQDAVLCGLVCPMCGNYSGVISQRFTHRVDFKQGFSCSSCEGIHTIQSGTETQSLPVDTNE